MSDSKFSYFFKVANLDINPLQLIRPAACPLKSIEVKSVGYKKQLVVTWCELILKTPSGEKTIILPTVIELGYIDSYNFSSVYNQFEKEEIYFDMFASIGQYMYQVKTDINIKPNYIDIEITETSPLKALDSV